MPRWNARPNCSALIRWPSAPRSPPVPRPAMSSIPEPLTAGATAVELGAAGYQLYVGLEGYGIYAAAAPHRRQLLKLVNAADLSARAAAPGSLVSVLGGPVKSARAGDLNFPVLASSQTGAQ